jgi:hypothetical protein
LLKRGATAERAVTESGNDFVAGVLGFNLLSGAPIGRTRVRKGRTVTEAADLHGQQVEYWNGPGGERWATQQAMTDRVLAQVATLAIEAAAPRGETVVDVGCGGGTTSRILAGLVGASGRVVGVDVSGLC